MKQAFFKNFFYLFTLILFFNCEKEDIIAEQQSNIETVSITEALNLFSQSSKTNKSSKTTNNQYAIPNLDIISQEEINKSNELLTVIPATTFEGVYSRILLLKIDGKVKSVVFSMVKDKQLNTQKFSGRIYITTLEREYINVFKVVNGILVSRFKKSTEIYSSRNSFAKGGEYDCWGITCGMRGEEIVIIASGGGAESLDINWLYLEGGSESGDNNGDTESWDYGDGEAGGGTTGEDLLEDTICSEGYVKDSYGNCVEAVYVDTSTPKIRDVTKELECFDRSAPAKLIIYVEQAIENSREVTARLGHTFIGLEQNEVVRNLGFYPNNGGAANLISNQDSEIHNNSGSPYHVSITINISASELNNIINYIIDYPEKYDLNNYNCSDFGIEVARKGGLALPKTNGSYGFLFEGRNPGDLGEDIRELTLSSGATRDLDGGFASERSANCP